MHFTNFIFSGFERAKFSVPKIKSDQLAFSTILLEEGTSYTYAGATRLAMRTGGQAAVFFGIDHLGSVNQLVDPYGAPLAGERQRYMPWGEKRLSTSISLTRVGYTGQYEDGYITLYWMNARWYDPALGRWVQPDSIVPLESQGTQAWDRFAYVNNNALRYIDPSGHQMAGDTNENGCSGASSGPACIMDMYSGYGDTDGMDASLRGYARNHPEYNFLNDSGLDDTGRALYANAAFQAAAEGASEGKISKWDALAKGIAGALAAIIIGGGSGAPDTGGDSPVIATPSTVDDVVANSTVFSSKSGVWSYDNTSTNPLEIFQNVATDVKPIPGKPGYLTGNYPGGGTITFRPTSSSGKITIDFHNIPGKPRIIEIKFPLAK